MKQNKIAAAYVLIIAVCALWLSILIQSDLNRKDAEILQLQQQLKDCNSKLNSYSEPERAGCDMETRECH